MYQHYPDDVKTWVDVHHAMAQIKLTTMRQPELATYLPSCRDRAASNAAGIQFVEKNGGGRADIARYRARNLGKSLPA
jgi:hypothetical protein